MEENPTFENDELSEGPFLPENRVDMEKVRTTADRVKAELHKMIVGQEQLLDLLLAALFTNGHVLVEGVPGIAKTLASHSQVIVLEEQVLELSQQQREASQAALTGPRTANGSRHAGLGFESARQDRRGKADQGLLHGVHHAVGPRVHQRA